MAIITGRFTWGWAVTPSNCKIDFKRPTAGTTFQAVLGLGVYTAAELAAEVARAMHAIDAGATYTCTYDFATRKFTLGVSTSMDLLFGTGAAVAAATSAAGWLGFVVGGGAGNDFINVTNGGGAKLSTDAVGAGSSTAKTWAPVDPVAMTTPVTAQADGSPALLLQRQAYGFQNITDGRVRESIYLGSDRFVSLDFNYLIAAEQTNLEALLDWLQQGRRVNYQPDATSTNALRLMMDNPGAIADVYTWSTRSEVDYPTLHLVEALTRT